MNLLANVLQGNRADLPIIQLALETLINVITYNVGDDERMLLIMIYCFLCKAFICFLEQSNLPYDITVQFAGINFIV
jgi:hypothetical protein